MKSESMRAAFCGTLAFILTIAPGSAQESADEAAAAPDPIVFPRQLSGDAGTVLIHTPQIDSWQDFAKIEGRLAVEVTPTGETEAVLGVAEFRADTDPNLELRVVAIENTEITVTSFPVEDADRRQELDAIVRSLAHQRTQYLPLDVILTYIAPNTTVSTQPGLSFDPPPIFYSNSPAFLVMTDGDPLLAPIDDTRLQYVVNTNWDLFRYREKEWYLRVDDRWLKNKNLEGPWKYDRSLPRDFKKIPDDENWTQVRAAVPPAKDGSKTPPTVFISDRPAELIVTDGEPGLRSVGGAGLEYVSDTESDLFRYDNHYYYLVSGRWFRAETLRGPWEHVSDLPRAFAEIPPDHDKGHVLAAVPNTVEARLAVLEASIPRKATVSRDAGGKVNVFFQGEPQFELIPGTTVERATNSYNDILKVGNDYYLCDNAVWYVSASVDGPWLVADTIPAAIYTIPPSSPSYHVTHVHVYESDDDSVSTGYTSGYFGVYVGFGVAMYGSGWYYPPYYGHYPYGGYPFYPYYYPYPYSYGGSTWYNPNTGRYGRSASVYGPYGGYGRGSSFNPRTGTYARGEAVWDSNEIAGRGVAYNPRSGVGVATNRYANEKGGWGESLITHNDKWIETRSEWDKNSRATEFRTSAGATGEIERSRSGDTVYGAGNFERGNQSLETRSVRNEQGTFVGGQTGSGQQGALGRSSEGDLYAGKDGKVYRRDDSGWHENTGDGWNPVDVPDERAAQIDQARNDLSSRRAGNESRISDRQPRVENRPTASGSFADSYRAGNSAWSGRTYNSRANPSRGSFDSRRRGDLNRSYNARSRGYQRYNNRSANLGGYNRGAPSRPVRRRR